MTPTPTPFYDEAGRRIYVRPQGRFLLVVEGSRGRSGRPPGTNLFPADPAQRPDLQILSDNDLGDRPTAQECDTGPPPAGGGVPGVRPPDFRDDPMVTSALRDLACRFSVHSSSSLACTRRLGDYMFLGSGTVTQFCFEVPSTVEFPNGDTVVAVQLRDGAGNLGPRNEIVVRVNP